MNLYEDQFSEDHDFPRCEKPSKILVIASTGRCGSHMLGHALHQTGKFGFPLEYANGANLAEWKKRLGINNFREVITELQRRRTSPNGVFGIKIHYPQLARFGGFSEVMSLFPDAYYVLLSRKDVLGQAISLSIAGQAGVWIPGQKPVNDNPVYSFEHIDGCLRGGILNTASWRYVLSASGSNFIELNFDYVRRNLPNAIKSIANFMDVEIDPKDIPEQQVISKQSNNRNEDWRKRFISEFSKGTELIPINCNIDVIK